jgi:hypothetical protein
MSEIVYHDPDCLAAKYPALYGCFCAEVEERMRAAVQQFHVTNTAVPPSVQARMESRAEYAAYVSQHAAEWANRRLI